MQPTCRSKTWPNRKSKQKLRSVGISHAEIHEIGPSLEDVFVTLSAKYAVEQKKAA